MTIPLVIQAASALGAEWKDTQRRFVSQALLSTTEARAANADTVGSRAFGLYAASVGGIQTFSLAKRFKVQGEFISTAREMMATAQTAPLISPHIIQFIAAALAWWLVPKLWREYGW